MTHTPELIRGEMRLWTDLAPDALRPAPRGRVLATLLEQALGTAGRVLVAGPHDPTLVAGLATEGRELTVVVRSVDDAGAIQAAVPAARVVCGGLDAFESEPYDAVVALDGVERVLSNDSPEANWADRLDLLRSFVAEGGVLVCAVDNPRSLLSLADARPLVERRDTGDWEPPAETDHTRPISLTDAAERLGGAAYSAFPLLTAASVLTSSRAGTTRDLHVRRALADSAAALAGRELLFDPAWELERWIDGGAADSAAAGWIFVVGATVDPEAIFEDHPSRTHSLVRTLVGDRLVTVGGPAETAPVAPIPAQPLPQGSATDEKLPVEEEPAAEAVATTAVTRGEPGDAVLLGELLRDRLRDLSLTEDLPTLRTIVGRYLTWVRETADPTHAALLTADNVVIRGDYELEPVDDSYSLADAPSLEVSLGRVALDTARVLLDLRLRRIWPPWMGVPELARAVAAMAGIELDEDTWTAATGLDESLAPTRATVLDTDLVSLRTLIDELRHELWTARGELFAHERIIGLRDKQLEARANRLHELERRVAGIEPEENPDVYHLVSLDRGSKAFKVARGVRHPVQAARWLNQRRKRP